MIAVSTVAAAPANASGGFSHSGSCSGTLGSWGYFYGYTYQYVYIDGQGVIDSESHSFSFSGFLSGADDPTWLGNSQGKWVRYRSGDFDIAVPYIKGAGLFVKDNRATGDDWFKLCSY